MLIIWRYTCVATHDDDNDVNDGDDDDNDDDDDDDNDEGWICARQQISRKFQLPTNFGEVLTDGQQTLYQLLTRTENMTIRWWYDKISRWYDNVMIIWYDDEGRYD